MESAREALVDLASDAVCVGERRRFDAGAARKKNRGGGTDTGRGEAPSRLPRGRGTNCHTRVAGRAKHRSPAVPRTSGGGAAEERMWP